MLYSKSTRGFYLPEIHGDNIPSDAVPITDSEYQALFAGQDTGMEIVPDAAGDPVLQSPAIPLDWRARIMKDFRDRRDVFLNRVTGIGFAAFKKGDMVVSDAADAIREGLLDLPSHSTVVDATEPSMLVIAIDTRYREIVNAAPSAAKLAFYKVDKA